MEGNEKTGTVMVSILKGVFVKTTPTYVLPFGISLLAWLPVRSIFDGDYFTIIRLRQNLRLAGLEGSDLRLELRDQGALLGVLLLQVGVLLEDVVDDLLHLRDWVVARIDIDVCVSFILLRLCLGLRCHGVDRSWRVVGSEVVDDESIVRQIIVGIDNLFAMLVILRLVHDPVAMLGVVRGHSCVRQVLRRLHDCQLLLFVLI